MTGTIAVRGCQKWGFFAEFFWVLNHLQWCLATQQTPVVYWGEKFAYYSPEGYNGSLNAWEYYFEPVSSTHYELGDRIYTRNVYSRDFSAIWWYSQYIKNIPLLTLEERQSIKLVDLPKGLTGYDEYPATQHLYAKKFRKYVKEELLDRFIVIKPNIQKKIDDFYNTEMKDKPVIGIHLRGNFIYGEVQAVPVEIICKEANRHAGENTVFFIATDQYPLLAEAQKFLKCPVIYYPCYREETTTSPWSPSQWPPEMGEDVLVETKLLSLCSHLVHTISNVSTAALYFNPDLPHTMLYCAGD